MRRFRNVFVVGTGRCGTMTFIEGCKHIDNYTAGHETRVKELGSARLGYSEGHIEADNRLSWFLGRLEITFGSDAFYVHLTRDPEAVALSFARRWHSTSIMKAYGTGIIPGARVANGSRDLEIARDYVHTVNTNIAQFLRGKSNAMNIAVEEIEQRFSMFWDTIGADGDLSKALNSIRHQHNSGIIDNSTTLSRATRRLRRLVGRTSTH